MKFIFNVPFDVVRHPADYMGAYGYENDEYEMFHEEIIAQHGEEIVSMKLVCAGYYDLEFKTGHVIQAAAAQSIVMEPL